MQEEDPIQRRRCPLVHMVRSKAQRCPMIKVQLSWQGGMEDSRKLRMRTENYIAPILTNLRYISTIEDLCRICTIIFININILKDTYILVWTLQLDSYNWVGAKPSSLGVPSRTMFAEHFLNLSHTAKWTPKDLRDIFLGAWQQMCFIYGRMHYTQTNLSNCINGVKDIRWRSHTYNLSAFFSASLWSSLRGRAARWLSAPFLSLTVFLGGVYLKTVSSFSFRLSASFKTPNVEIRIFKSIDRYTQTLLKTVNAFLSPAFSSVLFKQVCSQGYRNNLQTQSGLSLHTTSYREKVKWP